MIDDVDGDLGLGVVGKEEDVETVGEGVFRDALDGSNLLHARTAMTVRGMKRR